MSRAMVCDLCHNTLTVNARGEDEAGESEAWLRLGIAGDQFDLCTRSCLHEFIDRPEVIAAHDARYEAIAEVARSIREAREEEPDV